MTDCLCALCSSTMPGYGKMHYLCPACYALMQAQRAKAELERAEAEQRRREGDVTESDHEKTRRNQD